MTKEVKSYAEPGLDNVKIQSSKLHRVRIISQREFNPEVQQAKYCSELARGPRLIQTLVCQIIKEPRMAAAKQKQTSVEFSTNFDAAL